MKPKSLNDLTESDLAEVTKFAQALMTPREIAVILEIDMQEFVEAVNKENSAVSSAFNKGFLLTKFELNNAIVKLAKQGSSPAQADTLKMIKKVTLDKDKI